MALVEVSFVSPMGIGPVDNSTFSTAEIITSSAANQVSAGACQNIGQVCVIATAAGAVYAAIGATPDATVAGTRRLIPDGTVRTFWLNVIGHKVAIVNAP